MARHPLPVSFVTGAVVLVAVLAVLGSWFVVERPSPAVASITAECIEPAVLQASIDDRLDRGPDGESFFIADDGLDAIPYHGLDVSPICSL